MYFRGDGCYLVFAIGSVITVVDSMHNTKCNMIYNVFVINREEGRGKMGDDLRIDWLIPDSCTLVVVGGWGSSITMVLCHTSFGVYGAPP